MYFFSDNVEFSHDLCLRVRQEKKLGWNVRGPLTSLLARVESVSRVLLNKGTKAASAVAASATISDIIPSLFASINLFRTSGR
jgi:hypothetical protein